MMNFYWLFYFLSIVENLTITFAIVWGFSLAIWVVFTAIWMYNKGERATYNDGDGRYYKQHDLWVKLSTKFIRVFLPLFIVFCTLFIFTPSRNGILLIVAGGAIGEFITSDENTKEIPAELAEWFRAEISSEMRELKNAPIKRQVKKMTKEQLQRKVLELETTPQKE